MESGRQRMAQPLEAVRVVKTSCCSGFGRRSIAGATTAPGALRLADVLTDLPQMVWITDLNGQCIYVNDTFEKFIGASSDKLLNGSWVNYLHPNDVGTTTRSWQCSIRHKKTHQGQYRIRRHDNSYRRMLAQAVLTENADGSASHWVGTNTDIHEVYEAMRNAQKSLSIQQDFVRTLARDLKTPLGIIDVAADLALSLADDERRVAKYLRTIRKSVDRLDTMVMDLLNPNPPQVKTK